VTLRRVSKDYMLPPGAWLCVPRHNRLKGDTTLAPDSGYSSIYNSGGSGGNIGGGGGGAAAVQHSWKGWGADGGVSEGEGGGGGRERRRQFPHPTPDALRAAREMVLYCDDDVLVINKPAGLAVAPGPGRFGTRSVDSLRPALTFDAREPPRLVHRLDRDTSGCLILARNPAAAYALSAYFRRKAEEAAVEAAAEAAALLDIAGGEARSLEEWALAPSNRAGTTEVASHRSAGLAAASHSPAAASSGLHGQSAGANGSVERVYWALVSAKPAHGRVTEGTVHAAVAQFKRQRYGPDGKQMGMLVGRGDVKRTQERKMNKKEGYRWSRATKRTNSGEHVDFLDGVERMGALGAFKVTDARGRAVLSGMAEVTRGWFPDPTAPGGVLGRPATTDFRVLGIYDGKRREEDEEGYTTGKPLVEGEESEEDHDEVHDDDYDEEEEEEGEGEGLDDRTPVLLELTPQTGRKHQLRLHCAQVLRCPMVGDYKHGYRDLRRRRYRNIVPEWKLRIKKIEADAVSHESGSWEGDGVFERERAQRRAELERWAVSREMGGRRGSTRAAATRGRDSDARRAYGYEHDDEDDEGDDDDNMDDDQEEGEGEEGEDAVGAQFGFVEKEAWVRGPTGRLIVKPSKPWRWTQDVNDTRQAGQQMLKSTARGDGDARDAASDVKSVDHSDGDGDGWGDEDGDEEEEDDDDDGYEDGYEDDPVVNMLMMRKVRVRRGDAPGVKLVGVPLHLHAREIRFTARLSADLNIECTLNPDPQIPNFEPQNLHCKP
jgi:23S rRNA-/tRNA-specific pseudouridylate synthase